MRDIKNYQMLINGDWVDASDGGVFESINPSTQAVWSRVPEATEEDVNRAVSAAHYAFSEGPWSKLTPTERGKCLRKLGDLLADHSENLGRIETIDTGKMLKETRWQAKYIAEFFHFFAGCADKVSGETLPIDKPDMFVFTKREPLGVVAAVYVCTLGGIARSSFPCPFRVGGPSRWLSDHCKSWPERHSSCAPAR